MQSSSIREPKVHRFKIKLLDISGAQTERHRNSRLLGEIDVRLTKKVIKLEGLTHHADSRFHQNSTNRSEVLDMSRMVRSRSAVAYEPQSDTGGVALRKPSGRDPRAIERTF